jgi:hypothetical protein
MRMTARNRAHVALVLLNGGMLGMLLVLGSNMAPRETRMARPMKFQGMGREIVPDTESRRTPELLLARRDDTRWKDIPEVVGGLTVPPRAVPRHEEVEGPAIQVARPAQFFAAEVSGPCAEGCNGVKVAQFVPPRLARVEMVTRS